MVTPTQISYSDNTQLSGDIPLVNVSQLGPAVDVSFLVRNSGPSRVPSINLEIMWPLSSTLTGENFYLYITSVQVGYDVKLHVVATHFGGDDVAWITNDPLPITLIPLIIA